MEVLREKEMEAVSLLRERRPQRRWQWRALGIDCEGEGVIGISAIGVGVAG